MAAISSGPHMRYELGALYMWKPNLESDINQIGAIWPRIIITIRHIVLSM